MRLSEVRGITRKLSVTFPGADGTLEVKYHPNTFTADRSDAIQAAMNDQTKATDATFEMIAETIAEWDLEDDDGNVIPLWEPPVEGDPEQQHPQRRLRREVPMGVFGRIFQTIQEDQSTGDSGKAS